MGPTRHPIFLAVVLMTLLPWTIGMIESSQRNTWRRLTGWSSLVILAIGILATGSRGPALALVAMAGFALAATNRTSRWLLLTACVLVIMFVSSDFDRFVRFFDSNLNDDRRAELVVIDNEPMVYSGTRNRLYIVQVYAPLVVKGGPLGFGTNDTKDFPPNIPGLPKLAATVHRLKIIDNSYLNVGLRFGYVGLACFVALLGSAIATSLSLRRTAATIYFSSGQWFLTSIACALVGISLEIATVFWSYEFAFWVLFLIGTVAGMQAFTTRVVCGLEDDG